MQLSLNLFKYMKITTKNVSLLAGRKHLKQHFFPVHFLSREFVWCTLSRKNAFLCEKINFSDLQNIYIHKFFSVKASDEIHYLVESIFKEKNIDPGKKDEIIKVLNFLQTQGYSHTDIKEKYLDSLSSKNSSFAKIKQIAELDSNILNLMPFMSLSYTALRKAAKQAKEDKFEIKGFLNRIAYLSYNLETSIEDLIPALTKHSILLTMKFSRLHHKMVILKDAEIDPKHLVKDLWIFNYNEKLLMNRISAAEKAGVKLKPWMLRCSGKFFASMLNKYSETQRILNGDDIFTYLCKKLDCNKNYIEHMMERNRQLKNINIPKIDKVFNFLFEQGYTAQEIRIFPRVFCARVETLSKRIEEYRPVRCTLPTIPQLCVSSSRLRGVLKKSKK